MMSLPFFTLFAALLAGWRGWRTAAIVLWLISLALLIVLFRLHATDAIAIDL